jgi:hypothetical protein
MQDSRKYAASRIPYLWSIRSRTAGTRVLEPTRFSRAQCRGGACSTRCSMPVRSSRIPFRGEAAGPPRQGSAVRPPAFTLSFRSDSQQGLPTGAGICCSFLAVGLIVGPRSSARPPCSYQSQQARQKPVVTFSQRSHGLPPHSQQGYPRFSPSGNFLHPSSTSSANPRATVTDMSLIRGPLSHRVCMTTRYVILTVDGKGKPWQKPLKPNAGGSKAGTTSGRVYCGG